MDIKTIVVELGGDAAQEARLQAAVDIARLSGGHIVGVTATGFRLEAFRGAGDEVGHYAELAARKLREASQQSADGFHQSVERMAPGQACTHHAVEEEPGWALARAGRVADLILPASPQVTPPAPTAMAHSAEYVLMHAGRPVLVMPPGVRLQRDGHAVVAWNGRREAARAVADALPWLAAASRVTVVTVDENGGGQDGGDGDGAALLTYLARHGIAAEVRREAGPAGEVLLATARSLKAGLLVAGGYGHSRVRELVLGGATRALLGNADIPLLLSH